MIGIVSAISVYNAKDAIRIYQEVFDAKLLDDIFYMNSIPGYDDNKYKDLIAHSELEFGKDKIYVNDILDDHPQVIGDHVQFCLYFESLEELKIRVSRLREYGDVKREIQEEHWGAMSAVIVDKFGVTWNMYFLTNEIK